MANNYNSMKIPITINGYDCTDDRGCKELNDGDTVTISSYNGVFKCKIYKDEKYKYIPYLWFYMYDSISVILHKKNIIKY